MHGEPETWDILMRFSNSIVGRLRARPDKGSICTALNLLLGRVIDACNSIRVLAEHSRHSYDADGAVILRSAYDASLQALYILSKPEHRQERALLFLDFCWVEKYFGIKRVDANPSLVAKQVSQSPNRVAAEPTVIREFQRVEARYRTKKRKNQTEVIRNTWYPGNLRVLAKDIRYETEYDLLQSQLSASVHSSPLALKQGPIISREHLLSWGWVLSMRVLCRYAEFKGVALTQEETDVYETCKKSILGTIC